MDYSEFTDREGLQRLLSQTEPNGEPTKNRIMHVTKLEGALEALLGGVSRSHTVSTKRCRKGLSRPFQPQNADVQNFPDARIRVDVEAALKDQEAFDETQTEVIQGLAVLGEMQSAGSAGASGAVITAPTRTATPIFNPGKPHKLQPTQIPRIGAGAATRLNTTLPDIIATMALTWLAEAVNPSETEEEISRRRLDLCLTTALSVVARMRLKLSDESQRAAIFTNDNAPRQRRNRKSNRN